MYLLSDRLFFPDVDPRFGGTAAARTSPHGREDRRALPMMMSVCGNGVAYVKISMATRAWVIVGFLLLLAVGILVFVSGLIMPAWAVLALAILWALGLVGAIRWRRKPAVVLAVPFGILAIWLATAWIGDTFWGWTA